MIWLLPDRPPHGTSGLAAVLCRACGELLGWAKSARRLLVRCADCGPEPEGDLTTPEDKPS